ncbi:hypothetical protein [uncultured Microbacterium sp.]|uniref:Uncharacterized protein n=1 Tax=uncultured Microbacterium sp. TaxID=191216 RepID=A0A1Y5NU45_9MICO|nr:hypothetical protein [uncultured Microbacterium sp.]SBS69865.1 conserved membrane hypothetical protein [uncultured Microbacterium sp.]
MTVPDLAPRRTFVGVIVAWVFAAVVALAVGLIAPPEWRAAWMAVGLGACVIVSFIVHLWFGRSQGFIERVAASILGSLLVMGLIGVGFGLATLFSG